MKNIVTGVKKELKGYSNERIWAIMVKKYFKYWDYFHYDNIELDKKLWARR